MPTTAHLLVIAREVLGAVGGHSYYTLRDVLGAVGGHYGAVDAPDGVGGARDRATNAHYGATYAHDGA
jgi:hypothetical protein